MKSWNVSVVVAGLIMLTCPGALHAGTGDGLVASYQFNGNAHDASGNGNDADPFGEVIFGTDRYGREGQALHLTPSNGYVRTVTALQVPFPLSVAMWARIDELQEGYTPLFRNDQVDYIAGRRNGVLIAVNEHQQLQGEYYNGPVGPNHRRTFFSATNAVNLGTWHLIVVVFNAHNQVAFYRDGQAVPVHSTSGTGSGMTYIGDLGAVGHYVASPDVLADAAIDDLRIYNRALTPDEIFDLFAQDGRPPADLDIGFGRAYPLPTEVGRTYQLQGRETPFTNVWHDIGRPIIGSGQVEYGHEPGVPIFVPSRRWESRLDTGGLSLWFDGVDDFAFHPHDARLNLAGSMTLEAWVKPETVRAATLVTKALSPAVICYSLGLSSQNRAVFQVYDDAGMPFVAVTSATAVAAGEWRHVAASWDGSAAQILIDGQQEATQSASGIARISTFAPFQIGSIFGAQPFWGAMDQVRVWNVGRSELEIADDYHVLLTGLEPGLVGLWALSSYEGQYAPDSTPHGLDLQLGADPGPDASDPAWLSESFRAPGFYTEILDFGLPCLVVGHNSAPGGSYQLDRTIQSQPHDWQEAGPEVETRLWRTDHLVWGTNSFELFRVQGSHEYIVIDLSEGPSAQNYPVEYLAAVPPGGWTDEYKTTRLVMRRIPAGTFAMGSPTNEWGRYSDEAQHTVTLTKDFYMSVFQVTQRQWERVMGTWPSYFTNATYRDSRPVEHVTYYEIRENPDNTPISPNWPQSSQVGRSSFMGRLRARTALDFDLPTEAQWEYACRAGTTTALNSGHNLTDSGPDPWMDQLGRYFHNGGSVHTRGSNTTEGSAKVGSYVPNAWGLYDMHGNMWEYCRDWYGNYPGTAIDPLGPDSGSDRRVVRGGTWDNSARNCRSARRNAAYPDGPHMGSGFRLSMTVP